MEIRKISVGPDYKGGAMHYIVGQKVLNETYEIHLIKLEDFTQSIKIFIINESNEILCGKNLHRLFQSLLNTIYFINEIPILFYC
jgi:hypothetical protein